MFRTLSYREASTLFYSKKEEKEKEKQKNAS
jgi:hypothetical protein